MKNITGLKTVTAKELMETKKTTGLKTYTAEELMNMKSLRLYSPINLFDVTKSETETKIVDDIKYYEDIRHTLELNQSNKDGKLLEEGIMRWYKLDDINWCPDVDEKVSSAFVEVTILYKDGVAKLYLVCDVFLLTPLNGREMKSLYEYIESEYFEGIGDDIENDKIVVSENGVEEHIKAYLFKENDFFIKTEYEIKNEGYIELCVAERKF